MLFIQLTGLSGSGKTTLANNLKKTLETGHYKTEVIDGDVYRKHICSDLGFSRKDREENIRRLGYIGLLLANNGIISIMSAINPYEDGRKELKRPNSRLVWIDCPLEILRLRDTKGLYKRADLPEGHMDKITNLSGYGDPYEIPAYYDLKIETGHESVEASSFKLFDFVKKEIDKA